MVERAYGRPSAAAARATAASAPLWNMRVRPVGASSSGHARRLAEERSSPCAGSRHRPAHRGSAHSRRRRRRCASASAHPPPRRPCSRKSARAGRASPAPKIRDVVGAAQAHRLETKVCDSLAHGPGSPGRTRTCDPAVNSRLLYQLSYRGSGRSPKGGAITTRRPTAQAMGRLGGDAIARLQPRRSPR